MSRTHVYAIRVPDETWKKMKAVRDACVAAGINVPLEVQSYFKVFDDRQPIPNHVEIPVGVLVEHEVTLEIRLDQLPAGTSVLRLTCMR